MKFYNKITVMFVALLLMLNWTFGVIEAYARFDYSNMSQVEKTKWNIVSKRNGDATFREKYIELSLNGTEQQQTKAVSVQSDEYTSLIGQISISFSLTPHKCYLVFLLLAFYLIFYSFDIFL